MNEWEIWLASFPYEEDPNTEKMRPVVVLSVGPSSALVIKVTRHPPRESDQFDVPIEEWSYAHLDQPSTARISKSLYLTFDKFKTRIGYLHPSDIGQIYYRYIDYVTDVAVSDSDLLRTS